MMAKKSHKRLLRSERDSQLGCIWGLISIFDFRHGRSTRRLTSGKRRSSKYANGSKKKVHLLTNGDEPHSSMDGSASDSSDHNDSKAAKFDSSKSSVKALIDEEMSVQKQPQKKIPIEAMEQIRVNSGKGYCLGESHNHTTACVSGNMNLHDSGAPKRLANCRSKRSNSMERFSEVEEFLDHNHQQQEIPNQETTCSCHTQKSLNETKCDGIASLEERVGEAAAALLNQKLININQLLMGGPQQSKEFMDALEILNTNKDLFLKLLQDPNSPLVRRIQELQNAQGGFGLIGAEADDQRQSQDSIDDKQNKKQNKYRFFGRKDKTGEGKNSSKRENDYPAPNKIVVLKPGPATSPISPPQPHFSSRKKGEIEKAVSHFSIKGIKKKLKDAMRENSKEPHWASLEGIKHRFPYEHGNLRDMSKPKECRSLNKCEGDLPGYNSRKEINTTNMYSPQRESAIYEEAKKHLSNMLNKGVEDGEMRPRQDPRTLGRILSAPENNVMAPSSSAERNKKLTFKREATRFSYSDDSRFSSENGWSLKKEITVHSSSSLQGSFESLPQTNSCNPEGETQMIDSNSELPERILPDTEMKQSICVKGQSSPEGSTRIREIADAVCNEETNDTDPAAKTDHNRETKDKCHSIDADVLCKAEDSSECLILESSEEKPIQIQVLVPASFSGSPLCINKTEDLDVISEKQERPSPVSVLDQFFTEDDAPTGSGAQYVDLPLQPRQINFEEPHEDTIQTICLDLDTCQRTHGAGKESKYEYVRTMLEASGINHNRLMARWHSSDQLLDPTMLDEVESSSMGQSLDDQKLLFDCINEVLVEIHEKFFSSSPWISFVKTSIRPIPMGENLIRQVSEGVDQLLVNQYPHTLDQIVGKDLERDGKWMDLQSDVESAGVDMEEFILDRIMEETILELWDED